MDCTNLVLFNTKFVTLMIAFKNVSALIIRKSVIGGMMAGVVGQFLANPTDLVKVQMQMEGKRKLEGKPLR